jgi:hypothetical protein
MNVYVDLIIMPGSTSTNILNNVNIDLLSPVISFTFWLPYLVKKVIEKLESLQSCSESDGWI